MYLRPNFMAIQKPTLPKGTRDFGPAEVQKRKHILNTIETVFKKYGFMPLETPTMENLSTLEGKYGEEGDKLLFRILESGEYYEKTIKSINPELSLRIQNLINDVFTHIIERMIQTLEYNELRNPTKLADYFSDQIEHQINSFALNNLSNTEKENILNLLSIHKSTIGFKLSDFFSKSGVSGESTDIDIQFQIRNLRENYLNALTIDLISGFSEVQEGLSSFRSKGLTKIISEKGLRYDLTVPFARYVVRNRNEITFPFKRYQMQPVWRADRPQKGRYREFWQCDADVVGSDSLLNEVDLMCIYHEAFNTLGVGYQLKVNNRKVLAGIAEVVKSIDNMTAIAVAIDKLDKVGEEGVRKELQEQGFTDLELQTLFDIISIKGENSLILEQLKSKLQQSEQGLKGIEELSYLLNSIQLLNQNQTTKINLKLDFSLARGLSYYTGCIFEVAATEGTLKSSIGGGGRYDNLTGIFGLPNVSGVGISFGLDRIYDVLEELKLFPAQLRATNTQVLFCHFDEATQAFALPAAATLRKNGIAVEVYPDVVKKKAVAKQLDYANALQIPFAVIVGQTEMEQQVYNLKNLQTGEQRTVDLHTLLAHFS